MDVREVIRREANRAGGYAYADGNDLMETYKAVDKLMGVCSRLLTYENSEYVPNVMFDQLREALTEMQS